MDHQRGHWLGFGPKIRSSILNFSDLINPENNFLDNLTCKEFNKIVKKTAGGKFVVDSAKLSLYDVWLRRRLIKKILEKLTERVGRGTFSEIERVEKIIKGDIKAVQLSDGITVLTERTGLFFS